MFTGKINGVRLLADGTVTVTLTCAGDNLQVIANSRAGTVTIYADGEAPVTDSRVMALTNLHSVAVQIAEALDRELSQEIGGGDIDANIYTGGTDGQMSIMEGVGDGDI